MSSKKTPLIVVAAVAPLILYCIYVAWNLSSSPVKWVALRAIVGGEFVPAEVAKGYLMRSDARMAELIENDGLGFILSVNSIDAKGSNRAERRKFERITELADELILRGADVNSPDRIGYTPLQQAILIEDQEVVRYLLTKGAHACGYSVSVSRPGAERDCAKAFVGDVIGRGPSPELETIREIVTSHVEKREGE
ncbi:hypothetical protein [Wenzhouxiangella sp. XN24]|uniref:hypothetical protein n=1 Tax=Wenzhouxiangella sp. XN24 TaxID=2713569 RepID=UPI0013EA42D4|nr:hypothetical protein [Wenzhouxiangella sp. XN24]NGX17331.1 hypothetical protein [Wenzhouxiangella sp. XN24]